MVQQAAIGCGVVHVVAGRHRRIDRRGHPSERGVAAGVFGPQVVVQLHEIAVGAKSVAVAPGDLARGLVPAGQQRAVELALLAGRERDQSGRVPRQDLKREPWIVLVAPQVRGADAAAEVAIAGQVAHQQQRVRAVGEGQLGTVDGR